MQKSWLSVLLAALVVTYPLAVYFGLQYLEPRFIGLLMFLVFGLRLFIARRQLKGNLKPLMPAMLLAVCCALGAILLNSRSFLLFTPSFISFTSLVVFVVTLWRPPTMIERFARIQDPDLDTRGVDYTRKVTIVWCVFFLLNGSLALYTALYSSLELWTLYNGLISYILMGLLFAVEYLVRIRVLRSVS